MPKWKREPVKTEPKVEVQPSWGDVGKRVKLVTDLTRYHPELKIGAEGVIISNRACLNASWLGEQAMAVRFDKAGGWDIVINGLRLL